MSTPQVKDMFVASRRAGTPLPPAYWRSFFATAEAALTVGVLRLGVPRPTPYPTVLSSCLSGLLQSETGLSDFLKSWCLNSRYDH